jgi:hypothetical protein
MARPKLCKDFLMLSLNADNVLLSFQRNALISTIAGFGIITFRHQAQQTRMSNMSEGKKVAHLEEVKKASRAKPVSGICLLGLGAFFFTGGTVHYMYTLYRITAVFGASCRADLMGRFALNCAAPSVFYVAGIAGLFNDDARKVLSKQLARVKVIDS